MNMRNPVVSSEVKLTIDGDVECTNLPKRVSDKLEQDLTFLNQQYVNAAKFGAYISPNIQKNIIFFEKSKDGKTYWIPRGYIFFLKKILNYYKIPFSIIDKTKTFPNMDLVFNGTLREYQTELS